jgi:hypothetical protein
MPIDDDEPRKYGRDMKVKTKTRAGRLASNKAKAKIKVKTKKRAGRLASNHNAR